MPLKAIGMDSLKWQHFSICHTNTKTLKNNNYEIILKWDDLLDNCRQMFVNLTNIREIDFSNFDTSDVVYMDSMFEGAVSFNQSLNDWDVSSVKGMDCMFKNAIKYTHSMSKWKLHSDCNTESFLKNCIMWYRFNDENDMPLKGDERLKVPAILKGLWR